MESLAAESLQALMSQYLVDGYLQDRFELTSIDWDDSTIVGHFEMRSYFVSPTDDGGFHLGAAISMLMTSQLRVLHSHLVFRRARKDREIFMKEFSIRCLRPVRETAFSIRMTLTDPPSLRRSTKDPTVDRAHLRWSFDVAEGGFKGSERSE